MVGKITKIIDVATGPGKLSTGQIVAVIVSLGVATICGFAGYAYYTDRDRSVYEDDDETRFSKLRRTIAANIRTLKDKIQKPQPVPTPEPKYEPDADLESDSDTESSAELAAGTSSLREKQEAP
ncbi:hypothetical protein B0T25DRAFT_633936 [Lasiosphaeria hispida]|uniref:Uncharacterized protein n=1 Tax=Lasiosphaeria hispida TaxID=260671 RepID=A0AAJ0MAN5_9PEZI|nr:hypothetical protein B0T25DRAFT_633936 [Lasiosphaeria hispida]